jgi:hypothetical protein
MAVDKTFIANLAIAKTKQGVTDVGQTYVATILPAYFADYTSVPGGSANETVKRICLYYESTLIRCLRDLKPAFARRFADLDNEIKINKEMGSFDYWFELPSDYLELVAQVDEGNIKTHYEAEVIDFSGWSHTVEGTDDNVYYCKLGHTSATADKPITGANYATYWTLEATEEFAGADWEASKAYLTAQTGKLLGTNTLSNEDGDSAYIDYLAYVQAGISDDPSLWPEFFQHAVATLLASEITLDFEHRLKLLQEYDLLARPDAAIEQSAHKYVPKKTKVLAARTALTVSIER